MPNYLFLSPADSDPRAPATTLKNSLIFIQNSANEGLRHIETVETGETVS